MPLFQLPVEKQYLGQLDDKVVQEGYDKFKAFFHDSERQDNIRNLNEEQFQTGFLDGLFVQVLGYTLNPNPHYNLTTEFKNQTDSKKADGAILVNGKAIGVIELKGTDTTDLEKISAQAFNYKNNQSSCVYVVTSNFEKLRFYINDAVESIEFNLFTLTENQFKLLWLCLSKESILSGLPQRIKNESLNAEEKITKQLYADYSVFKNELWQDLVKSNPKHDKLLLYKKSQKLLDRFLFILFSEDKGLLPPNAIAEIVKQWEKLKDLDEYRPLYDRFKKYFTHMNEGWKGKEYEIFAYNGGLFQADELLDSIKISDAILNQHVLKLAGYDYSSEVDVNILGHIFEHSLSEIEAITAELEGKEIDKSKTKRKKDGIFYTPKYITKYIVDNTVGRLCKEKKDELGIIDEDFTRARKNRRKETIKKLDVLLEKYRKWLLQITICDPACGSGAFLNQALDFLIKEHRHIDELHAQLFGGTIVFQDVENHILETNLYGVDINEESVEIARLSLWLRTAHKGRKLSSLNNNIKCGNSLVGEKSVAGAKAFIWKDKFDIVIGNPPYGAQLTEEEKGYLTKTYKCFGGNFDIYSAFMQLAFTILKKDGYWGFINPVSWQSGETYDEVRKFIKENGQIVIGIKLPYDVFEDAYVDTGIYIMRLTDECTNYKSLVYEFPVKSDSTIEITTGVRFQNLPSEYWQKLPSLKIVLSPFFYELLPKLFKNTIPLGQGIVESIRGILPSDEDVKEKDLGGYKKYFTGTLVRYINTEEFQWVNYGEHLKEKPKNYGFFQGERILIRRLISRQFRVLANLLTDEFVNKKDLYNLKVVNPKYNAKYLLAIINSKLISFLKTKGSTNATKDDFSQLTLSDIREIPIKELSSDKQLPFVKQVELLLVHSKKLQQIEDEFIAFIRSKFHLVKLSNKLLEWHDLDFSDFISEFKKIKIKFTLAEESEWMEYFNDKKQKAENIKSVITTADEEIDKMVYVLYGLTKDEVDVVEGK